MHHAVFDNRPVAHAVVLNFRWKRSPAERKTIKATEGAQSHPARKWRRRLLVNTTAATPVPTWSTHLRVQTASSDDYVTRETNLVSISHRTLADTGVLALL